MSEASKASIKHDPESVCYDLFEILESAASELRSYDEITKCTINLLI